MLSYNSLQYVQDMKIGHYSESHPLHMCAPSDGGAFICSTPPPLPNGAYVYKEREKLTLDPVKIPPRSLFRAQLFAVLWLSYVQFPPGPSPLRRHPAQVACGLLNIRDLGGRG
jgi:hypothetical protein